MRPIVRDFLTGMTALIGIAGLIYMLFQFKELPTVGEQFTRFAIRIDNAAGVGSPAPVLYKGVRIGQVESALVAPEGAVLNVRIGRDFKLPRKSTIRIEKGLFGDSFVELVVPESLSQDDQKDFIPDAESEPGFVLNGGEGGKTLTDKIAAMIEGPAADLRALSETYRQLGERLYDMVEPRTLADVEQGKQPNIRTAIERADRAIASAEKFLTDEAMMNKIRETVDRADRVVADTGELIATWKSTGETVSGEIVKTREGVESFLKRADEALAGAKSAADSMSGILERVSKGEGTAGQLMTNPDMYNSIKAAADRLNLTLDEIRLLAEQYRKEGLPVKIGG